MNRTRYVVTKQGAARGRLFGRSVTVGQDLWLTEGEATTPLAERLILAADQAVTVQAVDVQAQGIVVSDPVVVADGGTLTGVPSESAHDPLDHDGDGRKGGSLKGSRRHRSV